MGGHGQNDIGNLSPKSGLPYLDLTFCSDLESGLGLDNIKLFCVTAIWHIPTQSDEQQK